MEYIDIFDENNNPTGEKKEKQQAHEEGNFHRTAHIWIINDKNELLLQKRSASKKSHPNCWDISGAGHIKTGETVIDGVIRELKEELGVEIAEKDLQYITTVCKQTMSEIINDLKKIKIETVCVLTEQGFYTEQVYKNMGFKEVMLGKAYIE